MARSVQELLPELTSKDIKVKLQAVQELEEALSTAGVEDVEIGELVDGLVVALKANNFKVTISALACLEILVPMLGDTFRQYLNMMLPQIVETLADTKPQVREKAQNVTLEVMKAVGPTQVLREYMSAAEKHRSWRLREMVLRSFAIALQVFGVKPFKLQNDLHTITTWLNDPQPDVRTAAMDLLEEMHRHVGDRLLQDLSEIRPAQLAMLRDRFLLQEGGTAEPLIQLPVQAQLPANPRASPRPVTRQGSIQGISSAPVSLAPTVADSEVKIVKVHTEKELAREMESIRSSLQEGASMWETRCSALKQLHGLALGGAADFANFLPLVDSLKDLLAVQVSDLRSQVVRDACACISSLSIAFKDDFQLCADCLIPVLFKLNVISVKIMSDSGNACICSLLTNTRVSKCVPKIVEGVTNRAAQLRQRCLEYILLILQVSFQSDLERFRDQFEEAIRTGVKDSAQGVRTVARQCYWAFANIWEDRAQPLLSGMELSTQQRILEERGTYDKVASPPKLAPARAPSRQMPAMTRLMAPLSRQGSTPALRTDLDTAPSRDELAYTLPSRLVQRLPNETGPTLSRFDSAPTFPAGRERQRSDSVPAVFPIPAAVSGSAVSAATLKAAPANKMGGGAQRMQVSEPRDVSPNEKERARTPGAKRVLATSRQSSDTLTGGAKRIPTSSGSATSLLAPTTAPQPMRAVKPQSQGYMPPAQSGRTYDEYAQDTDVSLPSTDDVLRETTVPTSEPPLSTGSAMNLVPFGDGIAAYNSLRSNGRSTSANAPTAPGAQPTVSSTASTASTVYADSDETFRTELQQYVKLAKTSPDSVATKSLEALLVQLIPRCRFEIEDNLREILGMLQADTPKNTWETLVAGIVRGIDPTVCVMMFRPPAPADSMLFAKLMQLLCGQLTAEQINEFKDFIAPYLRMEVESSVTDVRKSAVFAHVAIWNALGDIYENEYLEHLPATTVKLIRVYHSRNKQP
eukprot:TRINITY_DN4492_c0_g1_i1.p1 TRINITY_DN4492_c0_g1~~TRINITY_DN4492_c0_g1_i1.p1  ORF type:complete len:976 (+),score=232.94 TRINITY_DN4492_c0_g1_i1:30-2957(+)